MQGMILFFTLIHVIVHSRDVADPQEDIPPLVQMEPAVEY